jgi:hypothetical protein
VDAEEYGRGVFFFAEPPPSRNVQATAGMPSVVATGKGRLHASAVLPGRIEPNALQSSLPIPADVVSADTRNQVGDAMRGAETYAESDHGTGQRPDITSRASLSLTPNSPFLNGLTSHLEVTFTPRMLHRGTSRKPSICPPPPRGTAGTK